MGTAEINEKQIVFTNIADCKDCYRCIRNCPVKAIQMKNDQASVVFERCIDCGMCIRECPQGAKTFRRDLGKVKRALRSGAKVAVSLAPSFAGIFSNWERERIPSALRKLGFAYVAETAVGAYYSAIKTSEIISDNPSRNYIATACPAVVNYVEKYAPELVNNLAGAASPMVTHAKLLKQKLGDDSLVVFVGPCIAKKAEAERPEYAGLIDAVLTFTELREYFEEEEVNLANFEESGFDETPFAEARLYALAGGLTKTAAMGSDLLSYKIISVTGFDEVKPALEFAYETSQNVFVEPLFCSMGCINGPGVNSEKNVFERRADLLDYCQAKSFFPVTPAKIDIDLSVEYNKNAKVDIKTFSEDEILKVLDSTGKANPEDRLNCYACGYPDCRSKALAVLNGMAESEMCMPYMRRRAEAKTDTIIESSPNGIVILDEHFKILHMNLAFKKFFMCGESVAGKPISYLIDPEPFFKLANADEDLIEATVKHDNYGVVCHQMIYKLHKENQYVGIFINVTKSIANETQLDEIKKHTLTKAQELLNHQILMAQNIAKLLGESAARGEELVESLTNFTKGESRDQINGNKNDQKNWLWDMYTSR